MPAITVATMFVVATRPCRLKLLVTYGRKEPDICCWYESVKVTSQTLDITS